MPGLNINPEYMGEERRELSLLELNNLVRGAVSEAFPGYNRAIGCQGTRLDMG